MDYYALLFFRYLKSKGSKGLRMIYNAFKGGTEQLLPVNTDTPTTSPIIADIQYTDALRENQEFTYRECPITEDGRAKIKSIKGNTVVWNQLIQNGNFVDTSNWSASNATRSASDNVLTVTKAPMTGYGTGYVYQTVGIIEGHKYFQSIDLKVDEYTTRVRVFLQNSADIYPSDTNWHTISRIYNCLSSVSNEQMVAWNLSTNAEHNMVLYIRNCVMVDLTQMFGTTKADEIYAMETAQSGSGVAYFRSLFGLPYYQYDAGSLLSFNGTGIKTVGRNMSLVSEITASDNTAQALLGATGINDEGSKKWTVSFNLENASFSSSGGSILAVVSQSGSTTYIVPTQLRKVSDNSTLIVNTTYNERVYASFTANVKRISIYFMNNSFGKWTGKATNIQVERGDATTFEPYTSSTLDIPTSTYFPSGMKSAGSVYDELTNSKAVTRIGSFTIDGNAVTGVGTASTGVAYAMGNLPSDVVKDTLNIKTVSYLPIKYAPSTSGYIRFLNNNFYLFDNAFTDLATAQSILNANPVTVYYELAEESSVDVDQSDTNELLNNALSTIMGRSVSSNNPQLVLDVLTKGE